ncbi:MAG: ABC transporter permease [Pseudomonadota bacterium]
MKTALISNQLMRGFQIQRSVVFALFMKEYRAKLAGSRFGLLWSLAEPAAYMLILSFVWLAIGREEILGVPVFLFIALGMVALKLYQSGINTVSSAVRQNLKLLNYPNVKPIDAFYARYIAEVMILAISGIWLIGGLYWILGYEIAPRDVPLLLVTIALALLNALGLSIFLGVYKTKSESFQRAVTIATQPLLFVSAVFYPLSIIPLEGQYWLSWNPIVQVNELVRVAIFGWTPANDVSLEYLFLCTLVSLFLAYLAYFANRFTLLKK